MVRLLALLTTTAAVLAGANGAPAAVPDRVPLSAWKPLPGASEVDVSAKARALRAKLLGPRADDPDYVTLHWTGVSSFIVTVRGHLLLFDAWEILGLHADYLPIGREELAGLEPEAILIGHGHFDHAADAGYVAGRTGAAVVASEEQCDTVKEDAAAEGNASKFSCALTGTQEEPKGGTRSSLRLFEDVEPLTILKGVHSAARPPGGGNEPDPLLPVNDPTPYVQHLNTRPDEYARFLQSLGDPEGGTRMYHFRDGDFTLLLGDSAGPIFEHASVRASLDKLPGCVDVMANAIQGFDQPVSGMQDPAAYIANAHPRLFLPTHGDAWAPVISSRQIAYRDELRRELAALPNPPKLDYLLDQQDYLVERAYRVDASSWKTPMAGSSCARKSASGEESGDDEDADSGGDPGGGGDAGTNVESAQGTADGGGDLPFTGLDLAALGLIGAGLGLLGLALRLALRSRRA